MMSINVETFEKELTNILNQDKESRKDYIDITSKELYTKVGGYPG